MASSSCVALMLAAVNPQVRVVNVTTGPSKQDVEGVGEGEGEVLLGGALTKASSTLPCRLGDVLTGVETGEGLDELPGAGVGTATTVADGPVGVIGAGAAASVVVGEKGAGAGPDTGGCTGAGAEAGGALHALEAPVGSLQVSTHCDELTRLTVEACTKF